MICSACRDDIYDGEGGTQYWCRNCNDVVVKCYDCTLGQPSLAREGPLLSGGDCPHCGGPLTVEHEL